MGVLTRDGNSQFPAVISAIMKPYIMAVFVTCMPESTDSVIAMNNLACISIAALAAVSPLTGPAWFTPEPVESECFMFSKLAGLLEIFADEGGGVLMLENDEVVIIVCTPHPRQPEIIWTF